MAAADVKAAGVLRGFGMFMLLVTGIVFVGRSFLFRQLMNSKKYRGQKMDPGKHAELPSSNQAYLRIVVMASRTFGVVVVAIAAIQFSLALFNLATSGFQFGGFGSNIAYLLFQVLVMPVVTAGAGLVLLCLAEILDRVAVLAVAASANYLQKSGHEANVEMVTEFSDSTKNN